MKKLFCLLFSLLLSLSALTVGVSADVIYEPQGNDFYSLHSGSCLYLSRGYIANGSAGYITVYKSPDDNSAVGSYKNGSEFYVSYTYEDENGTWGLVEYTLDDDGNPVAEYGDGKLSGWLKLSEMLPAADEETFNDLHSDEYNYDGLKADLAGLTSFALYTYPCSGDCTVMDTANYDVSYLESYECTWQDAEGRTWGKIGYFYGYKKGWVCVDDPENASIPAVALNTGELIEPAAPGDIPQTGSNSAVITVVALIIAAAALTGVVVGFSLKRKKKSA